MVEENLVKKTCRELGINQKQLSEITGFATQTLSKWKHNSKLPQTAINYFHLLVEHEKLKIAFIKNSIS